MNYISSWVLQPGLLLQAVAVKGVSRNFALVLLSDGERLANFLQNQPKVEGQRLK